MATPLKSDGFAVPSGFPRVVRGYDPKAVDVFLSRVRRELEALTEENQSLQGRVGELLKSLAHHEARAYAVQEALVTAKAIQVEARESVGREAEEIRAAASIEAEKIREAARTELAGAKDHVEEMEQGAARLRDEVAEEVEHFRREALEEVQGEAEAIREAARREAAELVEKATGDAERLAAQMARLEQRRTEFLEFLARELAAPGAGDASAASPPSDQPVELHFHG